MRFESKFTVTSTTCEGVKFTVRRLNTVQRAKLDLLTLEKRVEYSEIWADIERLPKEPELIDGQPPSADPDRLAREKLRIKADCTLSVYIKPETIKAGLLSIEGLEMVDEDGSSIPPTVENLIDHGPSDLINEIWLAISNEASLTGEQRKNSPSPSTSAAPEGGTKSNTNADLAEIGATT